MKTNIARTSMSKYGLIRLTAVVAAAVLGGLGTAMAYSFMPLVTSFSQQENKCATQAWSATQDGDGTLYFGTSDGLLVYDGVRWESHGIAGISIVRSLRAVGNRVYIGAHEQFGYLEKDAFGTPQYHSLNHLASDFRFKDDEFWSIVPHGKDVYFQSFRSLLRYSGNYVQAICVEGHGPLNLFEANGSLFTQIIYKGLNRVKEGNYTELSRRETFCGSDVVAVLESGKPDKTLILCTEQAGLMKMDGEGHLSPLPTEVDKELKAHCINRAVLMRNGTLAVGTIRNGVYGIGPSGKMVWHYNIENGLGNNTVLGLFEDAQGNLWVMLDHGISLIHCGLPFTFLKPSAGEAYMGMTYAMIREDDRLYIGTNQGLYTYNYTNGTLTPSDKIKNQVWHIDSYDGQRFIGGGTLTAQFNGEKLITLNTNGSTDLKLGRVHNHEVLVEGSYYPVRIHLRDREGIWRLSHEVKGFGAPLRQIEIDPDGSVWCSHLSDGVTQLELANDLKSVRKVYHYKSAGPSRQSKLSFVMKVRGTTVFSDGDSLYTYNREARHFEVFEAMHRDIGDLRDTYSATPLDDRRFWLASRNAYTLVEYNGERYQKIMTLPLTRFNLQSNGVNNKVYADGAGNCYLAINNGVAMIGRDDLEAASDSNRMGIAKVEFIGTDGETHLMPLAPEKRARTQYPGNITFSMARPSYALRSESFRYELDGAKQLSYESDRAEVSFVGLDYGNYTFRAKLLDGMGDVVAQSDYAFTVPRPPYLSYWAMGGYVLAIACLAFGASKVYAWRQVKRQKLQHEMERVAQDVKILEQERIISEQQKQLLQNELALKGKELASMALETGYKDQVIENLRETLSGQRRKGQLDSREVDSLIKSINSSADRGEFWDIFHNNFDLIHENFFRNLRQQFPELTPTDLRFCALLRLNMSTKDIAHFTHLTTRGVETARYRIRRKLGLDSKASIVQFLIDFK